MPERSLLAWEKWRDSAEKFDYFALALSTATTAYIGQHFVPAAIGLNAPTLELAAVLSLAVSVWLGVHRVRSLIAYAQSEGLVLDAHEKAGAIRTHLVTNPGKAVLEAESGTVLSAEAADATRERLEKRKASAQKQVDKWKARGERAYRWRDRFFLAGITLYAASRLAAVVALSFT